MRQYRVWKHSSGLTEAVKHGWSWPAFFFGGLWAIVKRMTLIGIFMLLGSLVIGWLITTWVEPEDDQNIFSFVPTLVLDLFFGANGNSWREWHLKKRGFELVQVKVQTNVRPSFQTLLSHPITSLKTLWHDPVWSKVIATIIIGVFTSGVYIFWHSSDIEQVEKADIAPHHFSVPKCKSATMNGYIEPNSLETFVWFEWGETPDLGNVTMKQRFTENTEYYQDIINLKENTTYYYRAMASNAKGTAEGRVNSFTTAPCER